MITVTISETNGKRKWSHRARTKDAMTAIIRTMNKHFPLSPSRSIILHSEAVTHANLDVQVILSSPAGDCKVP
ncbi:hypothetical protein AH580_19560 [Salmonella enterica subsp. enterica serovar Montevideo]|nr:hypothetical protein [Salmonella enterica subsp. enterica serovar Montevideo]ECA9146968.1 hypothetical protein [Salmonella enterica subsp. enterica serovar Montevideo]EDE7749354.1 hypothetical protein [Salmonella enterica subsp. enterica serovar Montevideo]EEK7292518.1 hypothetical protein [Salmonella enterica subsp. enterica serovar Montevideo]